MGRHVTQLVIITIFSLFSRYSSLEDGPPSPYNYFEDVVSAGYDPLAYPSYLTTKDLFSHTTQLLIPTSPSTKTVNVDHFGATGDADDDTPAFEKAWEEACSSKGQVVLEVPQGKCYHLKPIRFSGPCKSNLTIQIYGSIEASDDMSDYKEDRRHWLVFDEVDNLLIQGGGNINGNGKIWWQNSCKINKDLPCKDAPTALTFNKSKNLMVQNLNIQDAQQIHVSFEKCDNVQASALTVTAPETSPNTDGIHVTHTQNIRITDCIIGTGDDCISIVSGSQNVQALNITCGPGHGISIGSLGSKNSKAYVSGVTVDGAKIFGTKNGVRIKTWQGGSGSASNIIFQNIEMFNVSNPIIIDQNYCDQDKPCKEQSSAVQVKNVVYKNIEGTSASEVAIKFDCSKTHPCQGILLQNVSIQEQGETTAKAICNNVKLSEDGTVFPRCC
ncbi:ARABIDOPSIS DEHISCENCE ZONE POLYGALACTURONASE 1 [Hibiscus trionum]|uniref:endo-polygalacturonase n=1 Tax=Hibiscus trionum TaxID=183268 RepID=A0A9W7JGD6_HIBTR|nr:ARABIDOPSIS DEHISCENCE ZONE POLYGALACTURONASE 1 [Hibiscus trionum]